MTAERYRYASAGLRAGKAGEARGGTRYLPGLECRRAAPERAITLTLPSGMRLLRWRCGRPPEIAQDGWRHALADRQGSAALELDAIGCVISREAYYPYGGTAVWGVRGDAGGKLKTHRHAGKERDVTSLIYYGFRYYATWLGRWVSPDPAGVVDGLNAFAMTRNNPATFTDQLGLYTGEGDYFEALVSSDSALGQHAILARGAGQMTQRFPDEAAMTQRNLRVANRVAHFVSERLRAVSLATHGEALLHTPEGRLIDWMIGGAHHLAAVEHARRAFANTMGETAVMLERHSRQRGEQIVLYAQGGGSGDNSVVARSFDTIDPHYRIFLNLDNRAALMSPYGGAMTLLHECTHLASNTDDAWYLPVVMSVRPVDLRLQIGRSLAQNVHDLAETAAFVEAVTGIYSSNRGLLEMSQQTVLAAPMVAARVVPRNADSVSALAFALGLEIFMQEDAARGLPMPMIAPAPRPHYSVIR